MRTLTKSLLTASILGLGTAASAQMAEIQNGEALSADATIAENAMQVQNFSTLVAAVQAAGLAEDLMGPGPFTVFAPTDEAFARLPEGTLDNLLLPENAASLETLLRAHVVPGYIGAAEIEAGLDGAMPTGGETTLQMLDDRLYARTLTAGENIYFEENGDAIEIAAEVESADQVISPEARIIATDIMSSNGVIHVIDGVLMPQM
ncbi:fasciclin domain-containing protein [Wenxinia marina]|uniref:Secreted and surface protein n=1 Tax=Wenxinia marina DSM 24838 TaxID=1123501 RepID=A0A0D0PZW0_9RHOB|nr:fasciclin domain-containing protein [Wenxinia marina]KIQ67899.1 Secreted and surface protein [Wenxinia marina DSM 24838]GGL74232.1 fasciclin [Wenxinia marina]